MRPNFKYTLCVAALALLATTAVAQVDSMLNYRGNPLYRAKNVMSGNLVRSTYYNYGLVGNIGEISGEWPIGTGNEYVGDVSPLVGVEFIHPSGDTLQAVCTADGPRGNPDGPPGGGAFWGFEPLKGFAAPPAIGEDPLVAMSNQPSTWPSAWPDKNITDSLGGDQAWVRDQTDPGWPRAWNGYFGKNVSNADQECYFQMDDQTDLEWFERIDSSGNVYHYYPHEQDSARLGLGLRVSVRGLQWSHFLAQDVIFWLYEITNVGTHVYDKVAFGMVVGTLSGGRQDSEDDLAYFDLENDITYSFDSDDQGSPGWVPVSETNNVGYVGYAFLESPGNPLDGIDNDGNGLVDDTNGWNFDQDKNVYSPDSHGTAVMGIIGAEGNNAKGVSGVNWKIKVMLLEVADVVDIVSAYEYVYNIRHKYDTSSGSKGSFVVATSASLGISNAFPNVAPSYCDAIALVSNIGILNACATTNSNVNIDITGDLPSLCTADNMIVVNSTKKDDSRYSSGYSKAYVDLAAPGLEIYTTSLGNVYGNFQGTSAATPVLGGGIALLFSCAPPAFIEKYKLQPKQTAQELKQIILSSTDPLQVLSDKTVSGGRLNLRKALETLNENYNGLRLGALSIDNLWPIPSTSNIYGNLTLPKFGDYDLIVTSTDGKIVSRQKLTFGGTSFSRFQVDVKNLATGVYIVTIYNGKEKKSARFVKL